MKKLIYLLLFTPLISFSQEYSQEELKLYSMIMKYRKKKGLPSIDLSPCLTFVAKTHVADLVLNKPDLGRFNAHSWSKSEVWTGVHYTGQQSQAQHMWNKPRELTPYIYSGYEIACGSNDCCSDFIMTADHAFNFWKSSPKYNEVIINKGVWKGRKKWKSIGISIKDGFAVVWFGEEEDHWDCKHCLNSPVLPPVQKPTSEKTQFNKKEETNVDKEKFFKSLEEWNIKNYPKYEGTCDPPPPKVIRFTYKVNNNTNKTGSGSFGGFIPVGE